MSTSISETHKRIIVAIDGHSSCGKSTMAKDLAREVGYIYVDTGAMYRTVTLFALEHNLFHVDGSVKADELEKLMPEVHVSFRLDEQTHLPLACLNGRVVESEIRGLEVSSHVSPIAALPFVRTAMTRQQQLMGKEKGIVMDGRDIGTVVFPDAELKIFVTASAEVRAQRRYDELTAKGQQVNYDDILKNVQERDYIDSHRAVAPLRQADDALLLDNSHLTIAEQKAWLKARFAECTVDDSQRLSQIQEGIATALRDVPYPTRPEGLYEPIEYVLSMGGKRLRPTLLLLAHSLYRPNWRLALPAAVGLETYHNHTLLHDDLMDHADMRRGKPTVHKKWDENTAVLSGDTMLIMAFEHFLSCRCSHSAQLLQLFARTAREICEGQQYDVNFETRTDVTEEEYIEMIRLKTSVLLGCAAKAGALIAEAPEADADVLYRFAEKVGLAFQLQDDYLDVYGDPAVFGKKIGGDILCGKKTFLLINALRRADADTRSALLALLANKELPAAEKILAVTDIYNRLDIPAVTLAAINHFYAEARKAIGQLSISEEQWLPLWTYAQSLLGRKS